MTQLRSLRRLRRLGAAGYHGMRACPPTPIIRRPAPQDAVAAICASMCLALFALRTHPRFPLIIAANRDEYYSRPTAPAEFWPEKPSILAGRDLQEGGTWLGVTRSGRFAAVTNYRDPREFQETRRSRGHLVRGYLESGRPPLDYLAHVNREAAAYNSFNLVVGDLREAAYFSNRTSAPSMLEPGVYGLSNHLLDTPWPKVERLKAAFFEMLSHDKPGLVDGLFRILADGYRPADHELPETGVGVEWERLLSSAFIKSADYGTRSSTLFLVEGGGPAHFIERRFGAEGAYLGESEFEFSLDGSGA